MTQSPESHELVEVYAAASEAAADVVVSYLAANGVEAFANTQLPHYIYPGNADAPRVLVNAADADEARRLLAELPEEASEETPEE